MAASIDLLVPAAHRIIGEWYDRTEAAGDGMPPHITLLWPWALSQPGLDRLDSALATAEPFDVVFSTIGRFPGVVYLAPEPLDALLLLMRSIWSAFPESPPYGGELNHEPVPHLTAAKDSDERALDEVETTLRGRIDEPLRLRVDRVWVSAEGAGPDGQWGVVREITF